jgi:hypothetical protein
VTQWGTGLVWNTQVMWTGLMLPENDWTRGKVVVAGGPDVSYHGVEVT